MRLSKLFLCLVVALLAGCATRPPVTQGSLTDAVPWNEIDTLLNDRQRDTLRHLTPTGVVILEGSIGENGRIEVTRIRESRPDHARDALAMAFGRQAVIHTAAISSLIKPAAVVYVVYFGRTLEGDISLTFAKRVDFSGSRNSAEDCYLDFTAY